MEFKPGSPTIQPPPGLEDMTREDLLRIDPENVEWERQQRLRESRRLRLAAANAPWKAEWTRAEVQGYLLDLADELEP